MKINHIFYNLQVLDLKKGSSQADIKARYRELSKKWHPDRVKDETEKAEAHERYVKHSQIGEFGGNF